MASLTRKQAEKVLQRMFGTEQAWASFKGVLQQRNESWNGLLDFFHSQGTLVESTDESIVKFTKAHPRTTPQEVPVATLSQLLDDQLERTSVSNLVQQIGDLAQLLGLEGGANSSAFTRMRQADNVAETPAHKYHLHLLAGWLGWKRPNLNLDYTTLAGLPGGQKKRPVSKFDTCVRLLFHFSGPLEDLEPMKWLQETVGCRDRALVEKNDSKSRRNIGNPDITSLSIDLPREETGDTDSLLLLGSAVRDAIAEAFHMTVSWLLSDKHRAGVRLLVGIAAGDLPIATEEAQAMVKAELPLEATIRVNELARIAARACHIRAGFCAEPRELRGALTRPVLCSWITHSWNFIYWDVIDELTKPGVLPTNDDPSKAERQPIRPRKALVMYQGDEGESYAAIARLYNAPHNTILASEIAKVLLFRGLFWSAYEIIRLMIAASPGNITARAMRTLILYNIALDQNLSDDQLKAMFDRIQGEEEYVRRCGPLDEDCLVEFGLCHLAHATRILQRFREERSMETDKNAEAGMQEATDAILNKLGKAERCFWDGVAASPSGHRSHYFLLLTRSLVHLLREYPTAVLRGRGTLQEDPEVSNDLHRLFWRSAKEVFIATGWLSSFVGIDEEPASGSEDALVAYRNLSRYRQDVFEAYQNAVLLRNFLPGICWAFAVVSWDFSPYVDEALVDETLKWLNRALEKAGGRSEKQMWLYCNVRWHGELQPAAKFREAVCKAISKITSIKEALKDGQSILKSAESLKLSLMFIGEERDW